MKNMRPFFIVFVLFLTVISCSDNNLIIGEWKLSSWDIGMEMDINKDDIKSLNLLDEVECTNKEILTVKLDSTLNSINTFNPIAKISKLNSKHNFNIECSEGSLGFASSYKFIDNKLKLETGGEFLLEEGQLVRTFENAINIYNEDFTEVIDKQDLTLTYTKNK